MLVLCVLIAVGQPAPAAVPEVVPVQGYLTSQGGTPVSGLRSMTFRIYGSETGTDRLHEESQDVTVSSGYFTVYLHPSAALFQQSAASYVSFAIDTAAGAKDGVELVPRLPLGLSPYCGHSAYCDEASYDPSTSLLVTSSGNPVKNAQEAIDSVVLRVSASENSIQTLQSRTAAISADTGGGAKVSNGLNVDGGLMVGHALTGPDLMCVGDAQVGGHADVGSLSVNSLAAGRAVLAGAMHELTTSGNVPMDQLGAGPSASKYLRGDGTWRDLAADDHAQYALLAGRAGGQMLIGGTAAGNSLVLQSSSNASRGWVWSNDQLYAPSTYTATVYGGTAAGNNLTLQSTSNATRGLVVSNDPTRVLKLGVGMAPPSSGSGDAIYAAGAAVVNGTSVTSDGLYLNWGNAGDRAAGAYFMTAGAAWGASNASVVRAAGANGALTLTQTGTGGFNFTGGNVGIGESPSASGHYPLVVKGASGYNSAVQVDAAAGAYSANLVLNSSFWASISASASPLALAGSGGTGNGLTMSTGGNQFTGAVGIGVVPASTLDVNGGIHGRSNLTLGTSSAGVGAAGHFSTISTGEFPVRAYSGGVATYNNRPSFFIAQRSDGTNASPTYTKNGAPLGGYSMGGYDGTAGWTWGWNGGAEIMAVATQDWASATSHGTSLRFYNTLQNTQYEQEALNLSADGYAYFSSGGRFGPGAGAGFSTPTLFLSTNQTTGNGSAIYWDYARFIDMNGYTLRSSVYRSGSFQWIDDLGTRMTLDSAGRLNVSSLSASQLVATDGSKNLVSASSPTVAGLVVSGATPSRGVATNADKKLVSLDAASTTCALSGISLTTSGLDYTLVSIPVGAGTWLFAAQAIVTTSAGFNTIFLREGNSGEAMASVATTGNGVTSTVPVTVVATIHAGGSQMDLVARPSVGGGGGVGTIGPVGRTCITAVRLY